MGARFRLKASFDVPAFCHSATARYCKDAKAVLREMQHYGLILADNGSNWFFQGSAFPRRPDGLVSLLKRIPARAFEAVDESCLRVSRNSAVATAKPRLPDRLKPQRGHLHPRPLHRISNLHRTP